jgi:hypothetical protein
MDAPPACTYITPRMTRLLLALLALLTGLSAQLAPAQARSCDNGSSAVGRVEVLAGSENLVGLKSPGTCGTDSVICFEQYHSELPREYANVLAVAVRIGIDRARE